MWITDQFTMWTVGFLLFSKHALSSLQLLITSTVILLGKRIIRWRADKEGELTRDEFKAYCLQAGITQEYAATNTPQQIGVSERVGRMLCGMIRCVFVGSGLPSLL